MAHARQTQKWTKRLLKYYLNKPGSRSAILWLGLAWSTLRHWLWPFCNCKQPPHYPEGVQFQSSPGLHQSALLSALLDETIGISKVADAGDSGLNTNQKYNQPPIRKRTLLANTHNNRQETQHTKITFWPQDTSQQVNIVFTLKCLHWQRHDTQAKKPNNKELHQTNGITKLTMNQARESFCSNWFICKDKAWHPILDWGIEHLYSENSHS